MTGRAVRFVEPGRVEVGAVPVPEPADGELLVRVEFSGISGGTEMLAYRGELDANLERDETLGALSGTFAYPFTYGYSVVGRVARSRGRVPEGTRVFAFHPHQDLFVISERDVIALDGEDARRSTLLPLVETALQACLDAGPRLRDVVAVLGLGCVGALTGALLLRAGARVIGSEPRPERRRAAARFGIEAVPPEELAGRVEDLTSGRGVPLAVEASGNPEALGAGLSLLAQEGTMLVCSWYGTKPVPLPLGGDLQSPPLGIPSNPV
jgi:2-desacetyl-2-hydroxyethyl bacteriochlorophyllide A dehydrogenase